MAPKRFDWIVRNIYCTENRKSRVIAFSLSLSLSSERGWLWLPTASILLLFSIILPPLWTLLVAPSKLPAAFLWVLFSFLLPSMYSVKVKFFKSFLPLHFLGVPVFRTHLFVIWSVHLDSQHSTVKPHLSYFKVFIFHLCRILSSIHGHIGEESRHSRPTLF